MSNNIFYNLCVSKMKLVKSEIRLMFYSEEGIFTLMNNKFYKVIVETMTSELISKSSVDILTDNSSISYKQVVSQIPADYTDKTLTINTYHMDRFADFNFIIVMRDEIVFDVYIDTCLDINLPIIDDMLCSFLIE